MDIPNDISEIATVIQNDWKNVHFSAVPYLEVMHRLHSINDYYYGTKTARSAVSCFLAYATHWRGPVAKAVNAKLTAMIQ